MRWIVRNFGARARFVILDTPCYQPVSDPIDEYNQLAIRRDTCRSAWLNRVWHDFVARHAGDTTVAPLSGLLCKNGKPIEKKVGDRYRRDGMHFTQRGAALVWLWLDQHVAGRFR